MSIAIAIWDVFRSYCMKKPGQNKIFTLAVLVLLGGLFLAWLLANPRVVMLRPNGMADWIRVDRPFDVGSRSGDSTATFKRQFNVPQAVSNATLEVAALRRVVVELDGSKMFDSGPDLMAWKKTNAVPMPYIASGKHELRCTVFNRDGPALLRLDCPVLGVATHQDWLGSEADQPAKPAVLASAVWQPRIAAQRVPCFTPILFLPVIMGTIFAGFSFLRRESIDAKPRWPARLRWLLLIAWLWMAFNNIISLSLGCGYDWDSHYRYIEQVALNLSLPRPDEGWQSFQSPLYYVVSAVWYRLLMAMSASHESILYQLRWIPLLSGAAILEICYRAGRLAFPSRGDLQMVTTAVGGLLPVNLYMAQTVSNEPLGAAFSGVVFLIAIRFLRDDKWAASPWSLLIGGIVLGAACLTKINALLWAVPLCAAILIAMRAQKRSSFRAIGIVAVSALAISGWLMVRNYRLVGKPFYLESSVANHQWWQDPGYRTPGNLFEFGHVFTRPIYNGMASVWDSLYGTLWGNGIPVGPVPWNTTTMLCGLWLALVPSAAILLGMGRSVLSPCAGCSAVLRISTLAVGCFIAAIVYIYLTLPIYSCAKASYMLATAPCLGILAAAGLEKPMQIRWLRALLGGVIVCWAGMAYITFFAA
jgi:hypothetical protein